MPIPVATNGKNIWIAAGDGDLERVQELVGRAGISPNAPDENTYTPMHAAASYGHIDVLQYLLEQGGDINVLDEDGDTPLYTVESFETAKFLIEHGAVWDMKNVEGLSPAEYLTEDFPDIATYIESLSSGAVDAILPPSADQSGAPDRPTEHLTDWTAHNLTDGLMYRINEIMQEAEAAGRDPEEQLRAAVGDVLYESMSIGRNWGEEGHEAANGHVEGEESKRPRQEDA